MGPDKWTQFCDSLFWGQTAPGAAAAEGAPISRARSVGLMLSPTHGRSLPETGPVSAFEEEKEPIGGVTCRGSSSILRDAMTIQRMPGASHRRISLQPAAGREPSGLQASEREPSAANAVPPWQRIVASTCHESYFRFGSYPPSLWPPAGCHLGSIRPIQ